MAGSHEVRGSIPLGSTTDPRGARRRWRAPLFLLPGPIGRKGLIGQKVCLIQGRRRGPAPLSRSPGLAGPIQAPGRKARPRRAWASRGRGARARPPRARGGRAGPRSGASRRSATGRGRVRRSAASAPPSSKGPIGPRKKAARRRRKGRRRNRGGSGFGGGFANPGIGGLPEALDVRRPLSRGGGPRGDAAIEPASRTPKKGPIYRRASAGLGRPRREPDPRARRRLIYEMAGAFAHAAEEAP